MLENDRVEFKSEINDKLEKELVAFFNNQKGGILYIGLDDSGHPVGNMNIDSKRIHTTMRNITSPRQDLTFAQLRIYYEERGLELNKKFANSLELLTPDGKYNYIGYLLADENGVSIKVAKYNGRDKVDLIENEEYGYCSLIKAANNVLDKLKIENITKAKVTSTRRLEHNLVNPVALREAIVNAIVHNDFSREIPPVFEIFSDRFEMTSYGGLISGQSEEDFFSCSSMPRNRELMRVFKDAGLVEQLGSGMSRILKAYDRSVFRISEHFIKVVFPFYSDNSISGNINGNINDNINGNINDKGSSNGNLNETVLLILQKFPAITLEEISTKINRSKRTVSRLVKQLQSSGKLRRIGSNKGGHWEVTRNI